MFTVSCSPDTLQRGTSGSRAGTSLSLPPAGRAALWHFYQRFKFDRGDKLSIDLSTLSQLQFQGDLEGFLAALDYMLMALTKQPVEDFLLALVLHLGQHIR